MGNKTRPVGDKWAINHGLLAQTKMNVSPQGGVLSASSCRITPCPGLKRLPALHFFAIRGSFWGKGAKPL